VRALTCVKSSSLGYVEKLSFHVISMLHFIFLPRDIAYMLVARFFSGPLTLCFPDPVMRSNRIIEGEIGFSSIFVTIQEYFTESTLISSSI